MKICSAWSIAACFRSAVRRINNPRKDDSMKRQRALIAVVGIALLIAAQRAGALPPPPSAPLTLWNFLGIPQGLHKIRDATFNKKGNFPGAERLPPMKAIADPENLKSDNPAIKAAAAIKTEEDLAPQKIKALKYLSTIGCDSGCYPEVKEALMAALEDCTEEVRYQAVLAIQDAITQHCVMCDKACCCSEDMTLKLSQRAYERDDHGCFIEPSERVREAAKIVMCTCCPGRGPTSETPTEPLPEGAPTPMPPTVPEGAGAQSSIWREGVLTRMLLMPESRAPMMAARPYVPRKEVAPQAGLAVSEAANPASQPTRLQPPLPPLPNTRLASTSKIVPNEDEPSATGAETRARGQSSRRNAAQRGLAKKPESQASRDDDPAARGLAPLD
jgi:hypothetical protein